MQAPKIYIRFEARKSSLKILRGPTESTDPALGLGDESDAQAGARVPGQVSALQCGPNTQVYLHRHPPVYCHPSGTQLPMCTGNRRLAVSVLFCHCPKSPLVMVVVVVGVGAFSLPGWCLHHSSAWFPGVPKVSPAALLPSPASGPSPAELSRKVSPAQCFAAASGPPGSSERARGHSTVILKGPWRSVPTKSPLLGALRQSLPKPVNEIQNRAAEFALRTVVKHVRTLGPYTSFSLHLTANYKMLSFLRWNRSLKDHLSGAPVIWSP